MARKLHRKRPFRAHAGFTRMDVKSRILRVLRHQKEEPIGIRVLEIQAQIKREEHAAFLETLQQMEESGEIWRRKNSVVLSNSQGLVQAKIVSLNEKFGFARPEPKEGEAPVTDRSQDIFLPGRFMQGAMPGDLVLVRIQPQKKQDENHSQEGSVVRILQENDAAFTGVVVRQPQGYFLRPDRLMRFLLEIEKGGLHGAKDGDKVLVKITRRGDSHFAHQVQVINTFGQAQLAQVCCQAVLADYNARTEFDEQTLAQARKIEQEGVPLSELSDRMDLTGMDIFTIDSADSKDLDDAVSLERDEDHWYLGVHIADVSHYVRQGSPLDLEAYRR